MELKPNMYVRTIGGIERLKKENDNGWFFEKSMIIKPDNIEKYIIKASFNIIDLVEVGDYVNGYPIYEIIEYEDNTRAIVIGDDNKSIIWEESSQYIKSIVTKEQFEAMAYRVGE